MGQKVSPHIEEWGGKREEEEDGEKPSSNSYRKPGNHHPLLASASDDGCIHVFHAKVYNDYMTNPLLLPVKKLQTPGNDRLKHKRDASNGVFATKWHPSKPWLFSAGCNGNAYLWV